MALLYSRVPVSHDSVTMSLHAQYHHAETKAAKWSHPSFYYLHLFFYYCDMSKCLIF